MSEMLIELFDGHAVTVTMDPRDGSPLSEDKRAGITSFLQEELRPVPDLTRPQFKYLLIITQLQTVWDTVSTALQATNLEEYARLQAQMEKDAFNFDTAMEFVRMFDIMGAVPDGVDVSRSTIKMHWLNVSEREDL